MYEIKLDQFSGPLEKLLELIEEKKLEITLVSLAKVTGGFLEYLKSFDGDVRHPSVLADFVVVASRLLLIKSKSLLPSLKLTEEEVSDIRDLEERLKIYKEYKEASQLLFKVWQQKSSSYGRELFMNLPVIFYPSENLTIVNLEKQLLALLQEIKALVPEQQNIKKVVLTLEMKIKELLERFKLQAEHSFKKLSEEKPKLEIILLFLAILHLIRDRVAWARQGEQFSAIIIRNQYGNE